jgi:hypothetical protein
MFRAVLECTGINEPEGPEAAQEIMQEFSQNRRHHQNVTCSFSDGKLILTAEIYFDPAGLALLDELSDCICAYVKDAGNGDIVVKSVTVF